MLRQQELLIPGGEARSLLVGRGQKITVTDVAGKQVADFIAFRQGDLTEFLSPTHTRSILGRLALKVGDNLYTNLRNPLFRVVEDTVGQHDMIFAACDKRRYLLDYGMENHPNCRDNFMEALGGYGLESWRIPDPINIFQNSPLLPDGTFAMAEPLSEPGDRIVLEVLQDAVVAISACPQDQNPCNGWRVTDILLTVS